MSKNSAIEIILRVRPHKNIYKGFSNYYLTQALTNKKIVLNSIFRRINKQVTLTTNNRKDRSISTNCSTWTPNNKKYSIKSPKTLLTQQLRVLMEPSSLTVKLEVVKPSQ